MKLTVRNYHLDGYGHVNNARYLEFLEEARWAFLKTRTDARVGRPHTDCRPHRHPIQPSRRRRRRIAVFMPPENPGMRRIVLTQTITLPNGKTAAEADITLMPVHAATQRTVSLPATLARALEALSE